MDISPSETPSLHAANTAPPRFFGLVAWSWIIFGGLGLATGLLSIPSFFKLDEIRGLFQRPPFVGVPEVSMMMDRVLDFYIPVTVFQTILSGFMLGAGYLFLRRTNIGRVSLSVLNILTGFFAIIAAQKMTAGFNTMFEALGIPALVRAGLIKDIPFIMNVGVWSSIALMIAPIVWMAWFFHSDKVKNYCR